ncbi:MAG: SpoIIE family protein phosphatase [Vicingaceae bacterium]|nr:SpoIIE family protein phosphatase [Vicingaceae bacterium]
MLRLTHIVIALLFSITLLSKTNTAEVASLKKGINSSSDSIQIISYNKLANHYRIISQLDSAEMMAKKGLELSKKKKWDYGSALSHNNLAYIYIYKFDLEAAMKNAMAALKIGDGLNDKENLGFSHLYIGHINNTLKEYDEVLFHYTKSLNIRKELDNNYNLGFTYSYIGNYYLEQNEFDSAQYYHNLALSTRKKTDDTRSIADSYLLLGQAFFGKKDYDAAIKNYALALEKYELINDKRRLGEAYRNYSEVFIYKEELGLAEFYLKRSLEIAEEIGALDNLIPIYDDLARVQEKNEAFEEAYNYLRKHVLFKDSITNNNVYREVTKQILKHKRDKEEKIKQIQHQKEKETQQILIIAISIGLLLVVAFLVFVYKRLQLAKRQNQIIEYQKQKVEHQKQEVESAHKEIKDSINYAKKIQTAILPPNNLVKEHLKESFILYKPKDIVAGDFYWMKTIGDTVLYAAADCTGHGVPGALVSVVCSNALNQSVKELQTTNPAEILEMTRSLVKENLKSDDNIVKDGMDIALCAINFKKNILEFSGANNPLYIFRNNELILTKGDKQPVGNHYNEKPFTKHSIQLNKGDVIYSFTDGFADQFGGPKGKKFMYKQFKELLLSVVDKPLNKQQEILNKVFETWKGDIEQIDDVCIIGVKI